MCIRSHPLASIPVLVVLCSLNLPSDVKAPLSPESGRRPAAFAEKRKSINPMSTYPGLNGDRYGRLLEDDSGSELAQGTVPRISERHPPLLAGISDGRDTLLSTHVAPHPWPKRCSSPTPYSLSVQPSSFWRLSSFLAGRGQLGGEICFARLHSIVRSAPQRCVLLRYCWTQSLTRQLQLSPSTSSHLSGATASSLRILSAQKSQSSASSQATMLRRHGPASPTWACWC